MTQKVLFLCPHNAAKSLIAVAYFNQMAAQQGIPFVADSAGTEPVDAVYPVVVKMLRQEGCDVSAYVPCHVTQDDLLSAAHIISMGCTPEALNIAPEQVELWSDLPMVSQEPERARDAIRTQVTELIERLKGRP